MAASIPASTLDKFTTFGDLLRYLRRAAGWTQLELSIQVGYSHAQISRLEQNLRLPDIPTIEARFVPALGLTDQPKAAARLLELAANVRREDTPVPGLCPYKGLNYFTEADAHQFVGREALTAQLTERVLTLGAANNTGQVRFLAIVGASGSGKSSLVRAGFVPGLRWNKASSDWRILVLTPTAHPLQSLALGLTDEAGSFTATSRLLDDLKAEPRSLLLFAQRMLGRELHARLLLIVDQFEETFALCRSEEEREAFIANLMMGASEPAGRVIVILTLRADFYAHCANYPKLRDAMAHQQEYIGAMDQEELRRAIEEPARRGRWELEPGLVELLLHDVGHEPGALPLLSHALLETWERRRGRTLTISGYSSSGGVRGAIAETAEAVFTDEFTEEQRVIARRIFLRLTELGDESAMADTRRRASLDELILKPEQGNAIRAVLNRLADARLITLHEDTVEVSHEALIREWPTLRRWLEEDRESLRLHRQLTDAVLQWSELGGSEDALYRGARLAQAREWAAAHEDELNAAEREFLSASLHAGMREAAERDAQRRRELEAAQKYAESERRRAEEQERHARRSRREAAYLAAALVAALILAGAAIALGRQAQTASRVAFSRELAAASISNLDIDPERSILLALAALSKSPTTQAEDALHRSIQTSRIQLRVEAHAPGAPVSAAFSPDGRFIVTASANEDTKLLDAATGAVLFSVEGHAAAYSPDGTELATVISDGTVRLWNAHTGEEIRMPGQVDAGFGVAFDREGSRWATVALGTLPTVWDVSTGRQLATFAGHTDWVSTAIFSPDGKRLLTGSDDGTARIWDAGTGEELLRVSDIKGIVWNAAYSPNGKDFATASGNEAALWDAQTGQKLFTLSGHKNDVYALAFNRDGSRLATGGADHFIKIWDAINGNEILDLSGHTGAVYGLAFSPDGNRLVSGSDDGTVRVWDLSPRPESLTLSSTERWDGRIAWSPDGQLLAVAKEKGAIEIRDSSGKKLVNLAGSHGATRDMLFTPDGARLIIAGDDTSAHLWDAATGKELRMFAGHTGPINGVALSPDGRYLATASDDFKVKIWDISAPRPLGTAVDHPRLVLDAGGAAYGAAFSPDGTRLASGIQDGTTRVWDTDSGKEILTLRGHLDAVTSVVFGHNGSRLATGSLDGTAKVWDAATGKELLTLHGHTDAVTSVAFSLDGQQVATASKDGTTRLWDASNGEQLLALAGEGPPLNDILFSPDGSKLAAAGAGGVREYILRIPDLVALAHSRTTRTLTTDECERYLHLGAAACSPSPIVPTTTPMPPAAEGRVCQVTNTAGVYDRSFNEMVYHGILAASAKHGWDARVLQSTSLPDFRKNIEEFKKHHCDLIVGIPPMADALQPAANASPGQKFLLVESSYTPPLANVWTENSAIDQPAFLAGYAAAAVTKTGKVGVFGAIDIPAVTDFMDGFVLGVRYFNEKNGASVQVLGWDPDKHEGMFVGGFCCAAEGRRATQELLDLGADIILPVAGTNVGPGAANAVQVHGNAYIIGVDTDWTITQPDYVNIVLTSIVKRYDVSVLRAVESIRAGTFAGGNHAGTLATGEVALAPFYQYGGLISSRVKQDLQLIERDIIDGKIKTRP